MRQIHASEEDIAQLNTDLGERSNRVYYTLNEAANIMVNLDTGNPDAYAATCRSVAATLALALVELGELAGRASRDSWIDDRTAGMTNEARILHAAREARKAMQVHIPTARKDHPVTDEMTEAFSALCDAVDGVEPRR